MERVLSQLHIPLRPVAEAPPPPPPPPSPNEEASVPTAAAAAAAGRGAKRTAGGRSLSASSKHLRRMLKQQLPQQLQLQNFDHSFVGGAFFADVDTTAAPEPAGAGPSPARTTVSPLSDLCTALPHLQGWGSDAPSSSSSSPAETGPAAHAWLDPVFTEMINRLPAPRFLDVFTSAETAVALLQCGRCHLPLLTASFEELLLQEAGTYAPPAGGSPVAWPPCARGDDCIAQQVAIGGEPSPVPRLTQLIFPDELQYQHGGALVVPPRPCVLCHRHAACDMLVKLRHSPGVTAAPGALFQAYRNPIDEEDGYRSDVCLLPLPHTWHGFLHAVVRLQIGQLRWRRGVLGRWYIDQEPLRFRPRDYDSPALPQPLPAESLRHFQRRSDAWVSLSAVFPVQRARCLAWLLDVPAASLRECEAQCLPHPPVPPADWLLAHTDRCDDAYLRSLARDAVLLGHATQSLALRLVHCEDTMPDASEAIMASAMWTPLGSPDRGGARQSAWQTQLVRLLSKAAPRPCLTRRFRSVCLRELAQHPQLDAVVREWTLVSLLGNMRHVLNGRSDETPCALRVRQWLYDQLLPPAAPGWASFKAHLLHLLPFILRDITLSCARRLVALGECAPYYLTRQLAFSCVHITMRQLRQVVHHTIATEGRWPTPEETASIEAHGHSSLLAIARRRPRPTALHLVRQLTRAYRPLPEDPAVVEGGRLRQVVREWALASAGRTALDLHLDVLQWLRRIVADEHGALLALCRAVHAYETHGTTARELQDALRALGDRNPEALELLALWCTTHSGAEARRLAVFPLSRDYLDAQTEAVRTRFALHPERPLLESCVTVHVCGDCGTLFDGIWGWTAEGEPRYDAHRGMRIHLNQDVASCDRCVAGGRPGVVRPVSLLGQALLCSRGLVVLCPQIGCAVPMVYTPRCRFNGRGVACSLCTTLWNTERGLTPATTPTEELRRWKWTKVCCVCQRRIAFPLDEPILFPTYLALCQRHTPADNWRGVWQESGPPPGATATEVQRFLAIHCRRIRIWKDERAAPAQRRRIQQARRRTQTRRSFTQN